MIVAHVSLRDVRSYERLELALEPGPRARDGAERRRQDEPPRVRPRGDAGALVPDAPGRAARAPRRRGGLARVAGRRGHGRRRVRGRALAPRAEADPAERRLGLGSSEELRSRLHALVFTPDRLAVVKGGPAAAARTSTACSPALLPARADLPARYAAALGQRNAALRRVAAGSRTRRRSSRGRTASVALAGGARRGAGSPSTCSSPAFAERADELGLAPRRSGTTRSRRPATASTSGSRGTSSAATTSLGPHLDEIRCSRATATSAPSGRRASSASRCSRCSSRRPSSCRARRRPAAPAPRRRALRARRRPPPACSARASALGGPDPRDRDRRGGAAARAGAAARRLPGRGAAGLMERLDGSLRRALRVGRGARRRRPRRGDAGVARRGRPGIAAAAWPQRLARDGTLHVNDGVVDLGLRARPDGRGGPREAPRLPSGTATPPALRFAPGPVPSPGPAERPSRRVSSRPPRTPRRPPR